MLLVAQWLLEVIVNLLLLYYWCIYKSHFMNLTAYYDVIMSISNFIKVCHFNTSNLNLESLIYILTIYTYLDVNNHRTFFSCKALLQVCFISWSVSISEENYQKTLFVFILINTLTEISKVSNYMNIWGPK